MEGFKIAFVGAGNIASHLAPALENSGYSIGEVYSRDAEHANELRKLLYQCEIRKDLDFSESNCSLFFLTVADHALEEVATEIVLPENAMVVHTSGTQPLSILGYLATEHIGVFYPLQTFSKGKRLDLRHVPIYIEAETEELTKVLLKMGNSISDNVNRLHTPDRRVLHLAAVFTCNFTNHLMAISREILEHRGLDFEHLHPLIVETMNKSLAIGPENAQTGPAVRGDMEVIQQHLNFLSDREDLREIYELLTDHIIQYHPPTD